MTGNVSNNPSGQNAPATNQTAAIDALSATMAGNLTLHNAIATTPEFTGENMPVKDFIQILKNNAAYVPAALHPSLVLFARNKLLGKAKNSVFGKTLATVEQLIDHLHKRFTGYKNYTYYVNKISDTWMKNDESVADFKDRLMVLLGSAESVLKEEKREEFND